MTDWWSPSNQVLDFQPNNLIESKKSLTLGSTPDIVAWSQEGKCRLKYVIYTPGRLIEMSWGYSCYCEGGLVYS
jgi:hypothetical protein